MKKIIPFKKQLFLDNTISEITSISLEHTLSYKKDSLISGEFIITGSYKVTDTSIDTLSFDFRVPCDINVDEKYDLSHVVIDIDDFYYEIIDNNAIDINIDVMLDKMEDRCIEDETIITAVDVPIKKEEVEELKQEEKEEIKIDKGFVTYKVCIVKEDDTLEKILDKYKIDKETLYLYNKIEDLKVGDKLIIPNE